MTGKAYLVGAGPGRADLISVRGLTLLRAADVVIYDRLIAQELLHEIRSQAERIFVGKQGYQRNMMPQAEINALLVSRVQAGRQVVRLKGGMASSSVAAGRSAWRWRRPDCPLKSCPASAPPSPRPRMPAFPSPTAVWQVTSP